MYSGDIRGTFAARHVVEVHLLVELNNLAVMTVARFIVQTTIDFSSDWEEFTAMFRRSK